MMFTENTHQMLTRSKSAERLAAECLAAECLAAEQPLTATAETAAAKKPIHDPSYNMMVAYLLTVGLILSTLIVTHSCGIALFMETYCVFNIILNYNDIKNYDGAPMRALEPNHWIRLYKVLHAKYNYLAIPGGDRVLESEGDDLDDDLEPEGDDLEPEGDDLEPEGDDLEPEGDDLEPEGDDLDDDLEPEGDDLDDELEPEGDDLDDDLDEEDDDSDYNPDDDDNDDNSDYNPDEESEYEDEDLDAGLEDADLEDAGLDAGLDTDCGQVDIDLTCITCDATVITKPNAIFVSLCGEHYCSACFPTVYENMNKTYIDEYYTTINPTGNDGWWDSSRIFHVGFWIDYQFTPDMYDNRNIEYYKQFSNTIDAIPLAIRMTPDPLSNESLDEDDDEGLDNDASLYEDDDEGLDDDDNEDLDEDDDEGSDEDEKKSFDDDANDWEHCSQ